MRANAGQGAATTILTSSADIQLGDRRPSIAVAGARERCVTATSLVDLAAFCTLHSLHSALAAGCLGCCLPGHSLLLIVCSPSSLALALLSTLSALSSDRRCQAPSDFARASLHALSPLHVPPLGSLRCPLCAPLVCSLLRSLSSPSASLRWSRPQSCRSVAVVGRRADSGYGHRAYSTFYYSFRSAPLVPHRIQSRLHVSLPAGRL